MKRMESEVYWKAVTERNVRFDGSFVFAVATTGIFCRPSCSARRPNRANVQFFVEYAEAEACGYRSCKRCRPKSVGEADPTVAAVVQACRELEDFPEATLEQLAECVNLSAFHLQRMFKQIIGVSPKKYMEAIRMERFRDEVRGGSDVVTAMYESGFGSSRGLYEKAAENLGMTPAVYQKGGKGMQINYAVVDCELGKMLVARTNRGICSVTFGDDADRLQRNLHEEFPNADIREDAEHLTQSIDGILQYLAGENRRLMLPLDLQATAFQLQVWEMLRKIPYGETRSYSDIAESLGDKKKVRAVARACATNKVALVIPCHRVIASDGKLSGYRWGITRKESLLAKEKSDPTAN